MKFEEFKYERPDLEDYKKRSNKLLELLATGKTLEVELGAINNIFKLQDEMSTLFNLVSIRNSVDTTDEFYEKEQDYFNEIMPHLQQLETTFLKKLLDSKYRKELVEKFGTLIFEKGELAQKTFSPEIINELQQENKLSTEYSKLLAGAKIEFQDGIYNLSQMRPFMQDIDRKVRHKAQLAVSHFFEENEKQIDRIYDDMVKLRALIAEKLGYDNFVQLGYDRFGRTDYNHIDVKGYRDQIFESVVPLVTELTARKAKRLGITAPKSYDLALSFLSGNPTPKGDSIWQVNHAKDMYEEMSPETSEFINFMINHNLLELDSKAGKSGGGYCTYLPDYNAPYIFANFTGTSGAVDVLTHEAGHAFQVFSSRSHIPEYRWPTMEAAEIHSMSMEFLAWPWIHKFFEEDTDKYKFNHLAGALSFLPYGVLVDEFQHGIYENPELTPDERKVLWRKIEKKYLPFKDYGDDDFLEKGTFWYRQGHIFGAPFYYIDYTLAQVCAFQFWVKSRENHQAAFNQYLALCKLGGSKSFVDLIESAKLQNPFKKGTVEEIIIPIKAYLDSIDDTEL
ncbi:MAG: M3 family oligoendopeptidase [Candidatus Izimaplasma sp.]|nr:M3 family oligoendopeptidase [Candidatus Izimaplasma bacterium]